MRYALVAVAAAAMFACSTQQRVKTETAVAKTLVSDQDEAQLGQQVQQQLDQQGTKYVTDPQVVSYVQGVMARLEPAAKRDRNINFDVKVIDDPKTVNAFAIPGGHMYVYSGLLTQVDNEAELAGVLGHEMGHVVARHAARQLVDAYGLEAVLGIALGQNPNLAKQIAASVVGNGLMLANSRADENEADTYGVKYSAAAGYDPHGIATFFGKLLQSQGRTPKVLTMLSDHPATADRITRVNNLIAEGHYQGHDVGADRVAMIKQRLAGTGGSSPSPSVPAQTTPPTTTAPAQQPSTATPARVPAPPPPPPHR